MKSGVKFFKAVAEVAYVVESLILKVVPEAAPKEVKYSSQVMVTKLFSAPEIRMLEILSLAARILVDVFLIRPLTFSGVSEIVIPLVNVSETIFLEVTNESNSAKASKVATEIESGKEEKLKSETIDIPEFKLLINPTVLVMLSSSFESVEPSKFSKNVALVIFERRFNSSVDDVSDVAKLPPFAKEEFSIKMPAATNSS